LPRAAVFLDGYVAGLAVDDHAPDRLSSPWVERLPGPERWLPHKQRRSRPATHSFLRPIGGAGAGVVVRGDQCSPQHSVDHHGQRRPLLPPPGALSSTSVRPQNAAIANDGCRPQLAGPSRSAASGATHLPGGLSAACPPPGSRTRPSHTAAVSRDVSGSSPTRRCTRVPARPPQGEGRHR